MNEETTLVRLYAECTVFVVLMLNLIGLLIYFGLTTSYYFLLIAALLIFSLIYCIAMFYIGFCHNE